MDTDGMQFENPIDNLTYLYDDTNKNQLLRVFDSTANPQGFSDDSDGISDTEDDYAYDDNGNMTHDDNKGITHITYNHLNLPVEIIFGTYGKIAYLYNATGQKLKKTVTEGTTITTTDYLSGFQYKNLVLQFFPHAEGYVNATEEMVVMGGTSYRFNYVFNYTDHLGNIRLSYSLDPSTKVLKIIEENHYYPFGLKHSGYNSDKMMYTKEAEVLKIKPVPPLFITSYKYKYNGKEFQDELGLNMYDYGARNYDPALGRWMNIDPMAEIYDWNSPYVYAVNNPVYFLDPDGMRIDVSEILKKKDGKFVNKDLAEAFLNFANSEAGIAFLSMYAEAGQTIGNHTYKKDGAFHKAGIDISFELDQNSLACDDCIAKGDLGANGSTSVDSDLKRNKMIVRINNDLNVNNIYAKKYKENKKDRNARTNYILSRTGTIFHESFMHAYHITLDYMDDGTHNSSIVPKEVKNIVDNNPYVDNRDEAYHHEMAKNKNHLFQRVAMPALISIYKKNNVNISRSELQNNHQGH